MDQNKSSQNLAAALDHVRIVLAAGGSSGNISQVVPSQTAQNYKPNNPTNLLRNQDQHGELYNPLIRPLIRLDRHLHPKII
ncbi:hypothetical protein Syun_003816 [Stephania yunnanensis]|uniref:Uncharacterized protein n=1 Tax=Stephania yunnanensis TaxID=152371 RepID=A0AAP0L5T9_9MAGN